MTPDELYDLIYELAPGMQWTQEELEELLCNADEIAEIGTHDLHRLVCILADKGLIDDQTRHNFLAEADRIAGNKS